MLDIIYSLFFGAIQGITEFFPISSSGHLVLFHEVVPLTLGDSLAFDVALHVGTLGALVLVFRKEITLYSIAFFRSFSKWNVREDVNQRISWFLVLATIPSIIVGLLANDIIESLFRNTLLVAILLIGVGLLFFPIEKLSRKNRSIKNLTFKDALWIGLAQVLAFMPGVSRSGITLLVGFGRDLTREAAARFSFLLAIPIVFIAGAKKVYDLTQVSITSSELISLAIGFVASLLVGFAVIKYFLRFVRNHSLIPFAWYRIALGAAVIVLLILNL
ncbi:undecaprenyl-diphosphate phosphatase [Patescibacteria group bacterium]